MSVWTRTAGGAAAAAMAVAVLAGCGSQATEPTATATVTVAPTTAPSTASATPSATPSTTPTGTTATGTLTVTSTPGASAAVSDPGRPSDQCADGDIGVGIRTSPGGGGAGSLYYDLMFTNTGGDDCALRGAPGVSVVAGEGGAQQGPPASRNQSDARTLTLAPGDTVYAQLRVTNIAPNGGPLPGCSVVRGRGYRVYPPHSTRAYFVQDPRAVACASGPVFMSVNALTRTAA